VETIARDTERDHYMSAEQALEYGLVDKIIETRAGNKARKKTKSV